MSTQSIGSSGYLDTYSLLKAAREEQQLMEEAVKADKEQATSGTSSMGQDILSYLSKIPKGEDGKLSFQDVDDYREELETFWDAEVMADLEELGVDITKQFPLTYDTNTGKVTVSGDHEDKEIIDQYFVDNPDKVAEFKTIVQLGKLTTTAEDKLSMDMLNTNLQLESLAWWYQDNTDPTSWFEGGGMLAMSGMSSYLGLNMTV
ncbi:hypothetical protein [Pseudodesulfovibrio portus]|uniref:Uncharacterized protein n=1 Tax=Pseudodesulfovibrio portus TaxID=231439 RepID=A0ABM8ATI7_9BACT|nr:hypothetical protein [Pseudodesulfovibrio portus]BDQ34778.1 hypothetical protein JCM14722_23200 [Pseudodesulfovibrio portus]